MGAKIIFEEKISIYDQQKSGQIDCIVEVGGKSYVFDFKRSSFGVPTGKEFENYEKIQLWFYIDVLKRAGKDIGGFGYINLSEPEKSLLYTNDDSIVFDQLFQGQRIGKLKSSLDEALGEYESIFTTVVNQLNNDDQFLPKPKSSSVCSFCIAASVCSKGES